MTKSFATAGITRSKVICLAAPFFCDETCAQHAFNGSPLRLWSQLHREDVEVKRRCVKGLQQVWVLEGCADPSCDPGWSKGKCGTCAGKLWFLSQKRALSTSSGIFFSPETSGNLFAKERDCSQSAFTVIATGWSKTPNSGSPEDSKFWRTQPWIFQNSKFWRSVPKFQVLKAKKPWNLNFWRSTPWTLTLFEV